MTELVRCEVLSDAKVFRGGVTAGALTEEQTEVTARINTDSRLGQLIVAFTMASKGGGETQVQIHLGEQSLRRLLKEIGHKLPNLADALAESTHNAVSQLVKAAT